MPETNSNPLNRKSIYDKNIYSNAFSITHNPFEFFINFKTIVPQVDNKTSIFIEKNNVVIMNPIAIKELLLGLTSNINNYEKTFGKIEIPKNIKKFLDSHKIKEVEKQEYFG